ncbi:translocation and assembly module lipoprotein TamL [Abyssalbus ytuae]|uniref:Outer membrane protein assembly factor n=1 Tax=Abyssalbus ytuae TaxID=2926907 RepID=A0A9E7CTT8_9FLAO|nr:BamA/TamA family outer membrane protein [Abyssalbus ytuae]UOB16782.1 outer membrane protein assembly factor [Abyssalbus ytuae]
MKKLLTKINVLLTLLLILVSSCNAVKRVKDDELLLKNNNIYIDSVKNKNADIDNLIIQQPNSSLLGYPLKLNIYNLAKENPNSAFLNWLFKKEKRAGRLEKFLSKKQLIELQNSYIGFNEWLKETGEPPVIINNIDTEKSLARLGAYFYNRGYFNNTTSYEIDTLNYRNKRAGLNYFVTKNKPYFLDTITRNISSKDLDSIYILHKSSSVIKEGQRFELVKFQAERERLNSIFLNSGIYGFQPSSITFDVKRDTIEENNDFKMPVKIQIRNLPQRLNDTLKEVDYKVHHINNVNIFADYNYADNKDSLKSTTYDFYTIYYKDKLKYKPKALTNAIAIIPGEIYRDIDRSLTYRQINNLKNFKYPSIEYIYADSTNTLLNTNIYLTARPRFSLGFNTDLTHSNIQDFGISFSSSLISRNVFRGAETLEISGRGTIGSQKNISDDDRFFNISEFGGDIKLNFPRIFFPLKTDKLIPKYMSPQTRILLGTSFQKNIGLDKHNFNGIVSYNWSPTNFKKNIFDLFNIQFIRNLNTDRFFEVYRNTYTQLDNIANGFEDSYPQFFEEDPNDPENPRLSVPTGTQGFIQAVQDGEISLETTDAREVNRIEERRERLTSNNLIFASSFTHSRNNRTGFTDNNFSQFKIKLVAAGNFLSLLTNLTTFEKNDNDQNLVFGVPYSQYIKTEFDYIKYWQVSRNNVFAFRTFLGIAIPYGNSNNIPFLRSYFAGGSNDNRAWEAYSLGPGRTNNINDFNEANLKIAFNIEYRFNIFGDLNGALFADAGNIWNVLDDVEDEKAIFENFSSLSEIALGTGVGLRYDFDFFVLRFDTGFKTYNPALEEKNRWFYDYFKSGVFNIGINYPF